MNHSLFKIVYMQKMMGEIKILLINNTNFFFLNHRKGKHLFHPVDTYREVGQKEKKSATMNVAVHKFTAH